MSKQKYPQAATSNSANGETSARKGRTNYSHTKSAARKHKRQMEAEDRQLEHNSLTTEEKITKAMSRRGDSHREIARLTKGLEWTKAQKVTAAAAAKLAHPAPATQEQKAEKAVKRAKAAAKSKK